MMRVEDENTRPHRDRVSGMRLVGRNDQRIGLALSGGGIRATIFHLGVLKWLAQRNRMEQVAHISSVSGASLCVGLIYAHSGYSWPKSEVFLHRILPELRELILSQDIQFTGVLRLLLEPWNLDRRVNLLAEVIKDRWNIFGSLEDLPKYPQWSINCTTFETGKDFRFSQNFMGDPKVGYVKNPDFPIAEAIAASAGFPVLIGPYKLNTKKYRWYEPLRSSHPNDPGPSSIIVSPDPDSLHLWDGGVYDNLGLEALYKPENCGRLTGSLNRLIVSNASSLSGCRKRSVLFSAANLRRLLDISRDQVSSLRTRGVLDYIKRTGNGLYVKIGTSAQQIAMAAETQEASVGELLKAASVSPGSNGRIRSLGMERSEGNRRKRAPIQDDPLISQCLAPASVAYAQNYPTVLSAPTAHDFDLILRHGYETAKCTAIYFGLED